jgi:hypothetical protein
MIFLYYLLFLFLVMTLLVNITLPDFVFHTYDLSGSSIIWRWGVLVYIPRSLCFCHALSLPRSLVSTCDDACHPVNILHLLSKFFETQKYVYFLMYIKFETWTWIYVSRYVKVNMDSAAMLYMAINMDSAVN